MAWQSAQTPPKHYKRGDDVLRISENIDKSRYARSVPLTPRARRTLDAICPEQGLIFRRFEYRRVLVQAARKVLATEHEARHLSAQDFRHAALTHMAAVGSDLTAIGRVAGHKNALYMHNSGHKTGQKWQIGFEGVVRGGLGGEELAERTPVREQAPQPARPHRAADRKRDAVSGGPSWTRTRSQWIKKSHLRLPFACKTQGHGELAATCGVTERQRTTLTADP